MATPAYPRVAAAGSLDREPPDLNVAHIVDDVVHILVIEAIDDLA